MDKGSEFVRLEEFVDNLLEKYKLAREKCVTLEAMIEERDAEFEKLKATIEELRSERSMVGEKVAGLIDRIEQWEQELESAELTGEDDLEKLQGKLFHNEHASAK